MIFALQAGALRAGDMRAKLLAGPPLAECQVKRLPRQTTPEPRMRNSLLALRQPEQENPLNYYQRDRGGEWAVAREVNRDDPWIRLLVCSPGRPLIVEVAVEIDGQPFRGAREAWIDALLERAKATLHEKGPSAETPSPATPITETPNADEPEAEKSEAEKPDAETPIPETPIPESPSPESPVAESPVTETTAAKAPTGDDPATATPAAKQPEDAEPAAPPDPRPPAYQAQGRKPRSLFTRLANYLAAETSQTDREELRWLLAEWTGGPALLALGPAYSWRRSGVAPLFQVLDSNHDRDLSPAEMRAALSRLEQADIDEDDIIDADELERAAESYPRSSGSAARPLVVVLDEDTNMAALRNHLSDAYGKSFLNPAHAVADIVYRVAFDNGGGRVTLLRANAAAPRDPSMAVAGDHTITIDVAGATLEFSAAHSAAAPGADEQPAQVAVGAVLDGYPLLRLLDPDNDHGLTQRERRQLAGCLERLDRDGDGHIRTGEVPTPIRLAVSLGPLVHQHLSAPVAARRGGAAQPTPALPAWFVSMDRNEDGDLSRREFRGNSSQFSRLDADSDGLISASESQASPATEE